jgi:tetratricopeptide (TPR) repeat protein
MRAALVAVAFTVALTGSDGLAANVQPLPLVPPPPDLTPLVQFTAAPLDKPLVPIPEVALPAPPEVLPPLPPAGIVPPPDRPTATVPVQRAFPPPCFGAWTGIASESLACGLSRYGRGEYDEAVRALDIAGRSGLREARYWLAESYWRLNRIEQADWLYRQLAHEPQRDEYTVWSLHGSGWTALRLKDLPRARDAFARLIGMPLPVPLDSWSRHGLGLALYGLGRYQEAQQTWSDLSSRNVPGALARDVFFWHGETLGRVGQHGRAETELGRFVRGGEHPLLETGVLRLGWWALEGRHVSESAAAFRTYLGTQRGRRDGQRGAGEGDWAEAGLALASLGTGDWDGARAAVRGLQARQSPFATPVLLRLAVWGIEKRRTDLQAIVQELLAAKLAPRTRAWVLIASGDAQRADGNRDEARTQYQLVRTMDPGSATTGYAAFRLAQTNYELREFLQTVTDLTETLAGSGLTPEVRAPALILQAEAAYSAGNHAVADAGYRRLLVEFPNHPETPLVRLSIAWAALRRDQTDEARRHFLDFARNHGTHPHAADALVVASELALAAGELHMARQLLDHVIAAYPVHPRTEFARLNRGILLIRTGDIVDGERQLARWLARAPFPPLVGRAQAALGAALLAAGREADATRAFGKARQEGVGSFAALGLGAAAMARGRLDDAARELTEARDAGTERIVAAAAYGLAAVKFQRGAVAEFGKPAQAALDAAPSGPMAPQLLYVLTGIAVGEQDWPRALATARRLITQFKDADPADDALERIGSAASKARAWPVVSETYRLLRQQYPQSPFVEGSQLPLAEAELEQGRPDEARRELEAAVSGLPPAQRGHALLLLARARQATGDRRGALEAYARAERDSQSSDWSKDVQMGHARLLIEERRWDQARGVLDRLVKSSDPAVVVEAVHAVGQTYQAEGEYLAAAEYYMTAAYLSPESSEGRRALLAAGQSFAALKQVDAAVIVYRNLLAQPDLPPDVARAARQGLATLGRP